MLLAFEAPSGPAWLFFGVGAAVVAGPALARLVRLPAIIGLLAGGLVIGPNALGIVPVTDTTVSAVGQLGLLYLMFSAGAELDLGLFARYRKAAATFGLTTFTCPFVLGFVGGRLLDYSLPASLLLGSLWASHTLVTYPMVRQAGLSGNRAVATAVGATVITDTLSLLVLAGVSGSTTGDEPLPEILGSLLLGLALLGVYAGTVLPRVTRWFFSGPGHERDVRYAFLLAAMLSSAVLAEVVGIEGIVGAFFAGLGLNRLVPAASALMHRVEFFGSAVLVPVFLVSVGLLIEPKVMVNPATLGVAGVFCAAVVAGKLLAALLARPMLGFTGGESSLMFGLTLSQAAATLAATTVGYDIGLFGERVVNAVLVVILVTLLVAALTTARSLEKVEPTPLDTEDLGRKLLFLPSREDRLSGLARVAACVVGPEGGLVLPLRVCRDDRMDDDRALLRVTEAALTKRGLDVESRLRLSDSVTSAVAYTEIEEGITLLLVDWQASSRIQPALAGERDDGLIAASSAPVLLATMSDTPFERVVLSLHRDDFDPEPTGDLRMAIELAGRLRPSEAKRVVVCPNGMAERVRAPGGRNGESDQPALTDLLSRFADVSSAPSALVEGDRNSWLADELRAGDLLILPAHPVWGVFGPAAVRASARAGVSVIVAVDPHGWAASPSDRSRLGALVGPRHAIPRWQP